MSLMPSPSIQMARALDVPIDDLSKLSSFELFQEQLKTNAEACMDAMKRLTVVAIDMGPDHVKDELVPYLTQLVANPHPDELLLIMGQELVKVAKLIEDKDILLPILEKLASIEETVVREQAVTVLNELAVHTKQSSMWIQMVKRLAAADWFTARVSVCGVLHSVVPFAKDEMIALYRDLCADETPMVRRAAAKHLGLVMNQAGFGPHNTLTPSLQTLRSDEQDSVRLLAVSSLKDLKFLANHPDWTVPNLLPIVKDGSTDMSWRVRNNLSKCFSDVAYNLGLTDNKHANEKSLVMACFVCLLTDNEAEVRGSAITHFARMVDWGGQANFAAHLQPLLSALADDVIMDVRSKCALALMDTARSGTLEDSVVVSSIGPHLESFLSDEFHEVQLQVLTNLHKISHLLPALPAVVSALLGMSKATNWRVREAIAQLLPHLAEARGTEFFDSVLMEPAWMTMLLDPVSMVRASIVNGMGLLVRVAGQDWILEKLMPSHVRIYNQNSNSYLVRITILRAHIHAAVECKEGPLWNECVVQILRGLNDHVANVRMVAAKGLGNIVVEGDESAVQSQILPALQKRDAEEEDVDCKSAIDFALSQIKP